MIRFERNWNVFGVGEPLLFPIKRFGQPEIHLAQLLREFFELEGGKCNFHEMCGEIRMKWEKDGNQNTWTISKNRGKSYPCEARNLESGDRDFFTIKDADLVQSLKEFISNYPNKKIDLAKIIGIGGEGTVLEESHRRQVFSERLIIYDTKFI